jgi:hypothetical protein
VMKRTLQQLKSGVSEITRACLQVNSFQSRASCYNAIFQPICPEAAMHDRIADFASLLPLKVADARCGFGDQVCSVSVSTFDSPQCLNLWPELRSPPKYYFTTATCKVEESSPSPHRRCTSIFFSEILNPSRWRCPPAGTKHNTTSLMHGRYCFR